MEVKGFGQIVSLENLGPSSILPIKNFDYIRGFVKFMMTELAYTPGGWEGGCFVFFLMVFFCNLE